MHLGKGAESGNWIKATVRMRDKTGKGGVPHHPCLPRHCGLRSQVATERMTQAVGNLKKGQGPDFLGTEPTRLILLLGLPLQHHASKTWQNHHLLPQRDVQDSQKVGRRADNAKATGAHHVQPAATGQCSVAGDGITGETNAQIAATHPFKNTCWENRGFTHVQNAFGQEHVVCLFH